MPTASELVFRIQAVGTDELKKVATAVESVGAGTRLAGASLKTFDATLNSLVASGKTYVEALQEMAKSQGVLSSSVVSTSQALLKHAGVVEETAAATEKLVGANVAAGAAIRDLTGQSNIRGIENLLTNVLGLGSAFQAAFIFTGALAAGEMLYKLWEKFDPLTKATKDLAEENKKLDQSYVTATANIERYIEAQARATLGPSGGRAVAAFDAGMGQAEQIFSNLTTPILQAAGHGLGTVTGGKNPLKALSGTILDPKNADSPAEKAANDTATNTKTTADEVHQLRMLLSGGVDTTDPTQAHGAAATGPAAVDAFGKATGLGGLFGSISKVLGLGGGVSSAPTPEWLPASLPYVAETASPSDDPTLNLDYQGSVAPGVSEVANAKGTSLSGLFSSLGKVLGLGAGVSSPTATPEWLPPAQTYDPNAAPASIDGSSDGISVSSAPWSEAAPSPTSSPMTAGQVFGSAATLAASALAIAQGVSHGGASGDLMAAGGAAAALGTTISAVAKLAGSLSPALAAAGPIGMVAGALLPMIGSVLPDSHAIRAKEISDEIAKNQYLPNTALNVTQSGDGMYEDFDAHGMLRTSTLRAVPTVAEPYITSRRIDGTLQYQNAPGSTTSPYSGSASGSGQAPMANTPEIHIHLNAIDTQSGVDFITKNHQAVGEALATHLQTHEGRASNQIRFVTGTN